MNRFKDENSLIKFFSNELVDKDTCSKLSNEILSKYKMYNQDKIIVDKMPFNFKWIGFIKILFPLAKIIHSNRNPIDAKSLFLYKKSKKVPSPKQSFIEHLSNSFFILPYIAMLNMGCFVLETFFIFLNISVNNPTLLLLFCGLNFFLFVKL